MLALKCSADGFIEKVELKGLHTVGGEWGTSRMARTAHPETLMMGLVKLWFSCWKEHKRCCQLAHVCVHESTRLAFPCGVIEDNFWQSLDVSWRR